MFKQQIEIIKVPRLSVNDDMVLIVDWLVENCSKVKKGDIVAALEMSKAAFEIEAPVEGYFFIEQK